VEKVASFQHQLTIPEPFKGQRLDRALARLLPEYSRSRLKGWINSGQVRVNGEQLQPKSLLQGGEQITVDAQLEPETNAVAEAIHLNIVYEDADLVVLDKPAGLVVHPGAGNRDGTLLSGLLYAYPELDELPRAGIVHRLDKDTSGLLVVARSLAAHTALVRDLQARQITREYRAVCLGRLTAGGSVDAPIGRHPVHRTRMAVSPRGRPAVTHYRVLKRFAAHSFLALRLESGRTHQIRVHMAHIRHPLFGDTTYGGRRSLPPAASKSALATLQRFDRQALHASRLAFQHPVTRQPQSFHAALPADMAALLAALNENEPAIDFDRLRWPEPRVRRA
jgi:23S rRNA pseudouridine1911/1915/1917 synthase